MKIYLLRHAEAKSAYPDSERSLTDAGRAAAKRLGLHCQSNADFAPAELWCSPYVRAQQTARILLDNWGGAVPPMKTLSGLVPDVDPEPLLESLGASGQNVLVVGHNPHLSILASLLASGERYRSRFVMNTCTMIGFEWRPVPNYGQLGPAEVSWMVDAQLL